MNLIRGRIKGVIVVPKVSQSSRAYFNELQRKFTYFNHRVMRKFIRYSRFG